MSLKDKVVVITGAAGGLGSVVARKFGTEGAKLVLVDNSPTRLADNCEILREQYDATLIGNVDVTLKKSVDKLVEMVVKEHGRIDVLVNIVGTWRGGTPVHETEVETWDMLMNVNAKSVFLMSGAVAPQMIEQGSGKIVSIAASAGLKARSGNGAYAASKSAVIRLTEAFSEELKNKGINVNCVMPSTIDTELNREAMPDADFDKWVTPEQIADVLVFLASEQSAAIHGAAIPVYGRA
ncbi:MAG: SDR family NAD(P)-dependent oxidoreductase [Anaerolineae bacterium]|nr:SDR family NAD(P)-dependent oxidoreductase [Anaerolineae bacterium]